MRWRHPRPTIETSRPLLSPETIEALQDDPELLALADAISATQGTHSRSRALRLTAAATVAAAASAAAILLLTVGSSPSLVSRALASVGNGPILHAKLARPDRNASVVDLSTGRRHAVMVTVESWYDTRTAKLSLLIRKEGALVGAPSDPAQAAAQAARLAALDAPTELLLRRYRAALHTAQVAPSTTRTLELNHGLLKGRVEVDARGQAVAWRSQRGTVWRVRAFDTVGAAPQLPAMPRRGTAIRSTTATPLSKEALQGLGFDPNRADGRLYRVVADESGHRQIFTAVSVTSSGGGGPTTVCLATAALPTCDFVDGLTAAMTELPAQGDAVVTTLPASQAGGFLAQLRVGSQRLSVRADSVERALRAARDGQLISKMKRLLGE